jgi:hypothetical protein
MEPELIQDNPFPVEAVSTFGRTPLATYSRLSYFRTVDEELIEYWRSYIRQDLRYGAVIGLAGSHGSGKTHLLSWAALQARSSRHISTVVLYAKADGESFFDLCTALISDVGLDSMKRGVAEALRRTALKVVGRARATEDLADRISTPEELPKLYEEQNLDEGQLRQLLAEDLAKTGLPEEIRRAVLLCDTAQGDKAYQWLVGRRVVDLGQLGLPYQLSDLVDSRKTSSNSETTAIDALEVIAALFRIAEIPLILLIDQMEVLVDSNDIRLTTTYSLIKKLFEQMGDQSALMFIAGTPESWTKLRRDIGPRLRSRTPIDIGRLNAEEAEALLSAYTRNKTGFTSTSAAVICRLAGGNPREILGIAYQAFRHTNGHVAGLDEDALIHSAQKSGSLRDLTRVALSMADAILGSQKGGHLYRDLHLTANTEDLTIDRLLEIDNVPTIAIKVLAASDRVAEVVLANDMALLTSAALARWSSLTLIVVSVGYSSEQIARVISRFPSVIHIEFDESDFNGSLQSALVDLTREKPHSVPKINTDVVSKDSSLELPSILEARKKEDRNVESNIAINLSGVSTPALQERERKTRREMIEALDELLTLAEGADLNSERTLVRSLLITNEAFVKNEYFEKLGDVYLDVLRTAQLVNSQSSKEITMECRKLRQKIIDKMLGTLRGGGIQDSLSAIATWKVTVAIVAFSALLGIYPKLLLEPLKYEYQSSMTRMWHLYAWPIAAGVGLYLWIIYSVLITRRVARWRSEAKSLRDRAISNDPGNMQ